MPPANIQYLSSQLPLWSQHGQATSLPRRVAGKSAQWWLGEVLLLAVCVCVLWAETSAFRGQTCSCEDVVLVQCQLFGDHEELTPRSPYSTLVLVDQKDGKSGVLDSLTCTHLLPCIFRDLRQVDSGRIRFSLGTAASKWLILPRLFTEAC